MRLSALLGVLLLLTGCSGFSGFLGSTFSTTGDPSRPEATAVNVQRANAEPVAVQAPITPEPGDVWPGPIPPLPSLAEIEKTLPEGEAVPALPPVPVINPPAPIPSRNAPSATTPPEANLPAPGTPPATTPPTSSQNQPGVKLGTMVPTSRGPEKVSGGTGNFLTLTSPGGQYGGILVPNGNGTSTIIRPDGTVETIPTPH